MKPTFRACLAAVWAAAALAAADTPPADVPLRQLVEAGALIEQAPNSVVKAYLQARLQEILAGTNAFERATRFDAFVAELGAAVAALPPPPADHPAERPPDSATNGAPTAVSTNPAAFALDVATVNLLTGYACILYDLDGHGFRVVRNELVNNVRTDGFQPETASLLRQLVLLCDEAERSLRSLKYVQEDAAEALRSLYVQNLGLAGATSIASGDPLPLLKAAASITGGQLKLHRERDRKLDVEVQNHRSRLANFLFALNVRRSDMQAAGAGESFFITKEAYDQLQQALQLPDAHTRLIALRRCEAANPAYREARQCLALALDEAGLRDEAEPRLRQLAAERSPVLAMDGMRATACAMLAGYHLRQGNYEEAIRRAEDSLDEHPQRAAAYNVRGLASLRLGRIEPAYTNILHALRLEPANSAYLWSAAQLAAEGYQRGDVALALVDTAIRCGFTDFASIYAFAPLRHELASSRGQYILQPWVQVHCRPSLLTHALKLTNHASYALNDLDISLRVRYETASGEPHEMDLTRLVPELPARGSLVFARTAPPKGATRCRMQLAYRCRQHPSHRFESVSAWNWEGDGRNQWYHHALNEEALAALGQSEPAAYASAYRKAREAAQLTFQQDPDVLDTCTRLAAKLGRADEAREFQAGIYQVQYDVGLVSTNAIEQTLMRMRTGGGKPQ